MFEMLPLLEAPSYVHFLFLFCCTETLDILNLVFLDVVKNWINISYLTATLDLVVCHISIEYDIENFFFADVSTSWLTPLNSLLCSVT
jgi:hypothetical protein